LGYIRTISRQYRVNFQAITGVAAVLCLVLPLTSSNRPVSRASTGPAPAAEPAELRRERGRGNLLLREGKYLEAVSVYRAGLAAAKAAGSAAAAVRFEANLGGAYYHMHRYREALRSYAEARRLARALGDMEMVAAVSVNLSSLYLQLGEADAAAEVARSGLEIRDARSARFRAELLIHTAQLRAAMKDIEGARAAFHEAIDAARAQKDSRSETQALTEMGTVLAANGFAREAIPYLMTAVRMREESGSPFINFSYEALGRAREEQGEHEAAIAVLTRAIESARAASAAAGLWSAHYTRGQVYLRLGRNELAYKDMFDALEWARQWKAEVLPADSFGLSTSVELHDIYSGFIEAATRLYLDTGRQKYAQEAFAAAEEIRAVSLRALFQRGGAWLKWLPEQYWQDLMRLQSALMREASPQTAEELRKLRVSLAEMEAEAGLEAPVVESEWNAAAMFARLRSALQPGETYLGFHLGKERSYLYALGRGKFELHTLPAERELTGAVTRFAKEVAGDSPSAPRRGGELYRTLFGNVSAALRRNPHWILGLDGELFGLPFSALVEGDPAPSAYCIERHTLHIVPSAFSLLSEAPRGARGRLFVGFGDPIYNRADPRWHGAKEPSRGFTNLRMALLRSPAGATRQLARLPGSGREVEACARTWGGETAPVLLRGDAASKSSLLRAIERRPEVLHIAAHVIIPQHSPSTALLATTLGPAGEVEYLSAMEIASLRSQLGLVVLNGCSSANGAVLPGEGLMGLTRAWLTAGASAVIASRWPVSDDSGDLFSEVYSAPFRSGSRGSFSRALQRAQIATLRGGGPGARLSHWAAYFCIERN
jgi:CHAT domain-containing protein/tetratricopeptide (TPR) repeat protein